MDQLIRLKATGTPEQFAEKMGMTPRHLSRYIRVMKELGAPIVYDRMSQSYSYEKEGRMVMGWVG